eukprot:m.26451 g.26451  ORF g.26451 m.26451 type:complete len:401 (+) comp38590_c0_seq1:546-1748(+)
MGGLGLVDPALRVGAVLPGHAGVAAGRGRTGQRAYEAPALARVDKEGEAREAVEEEVFAPEALLVVGILGDVAALLVADDLPGLGLVAVDGQRAAAAQRDQRRQAAVLWREAQCLGLPLGQVDDGVALGADHAFGLRELGFQRRTATGAADAAALELGLGNGLALGRGAQALQGQVRELHGPADRPDRRAVLAVFQRADLALGVAQLDDAARSRHARQLAFGRTQGGLHDGCHLPALAGQRERQADARGFGRCVRKRRFQAEDELAVVLAEPGDAWGVTAGIEQQMPLVPVAQFGAALHATDDGKALAHPAAARAELQRGIVLKDLGALADAGERVAVTQQRAAAKAADGARRRGARELDGRAAIRACRPPAALGLFSQASSGGPLFWRRIPRRSGCPWP